MSNLFQRLLPINAFKETLCRFPLSIVCSLYLFGLMVLVIHDIVDIDKQLDIFGQQFVLAACGYLWFVNSRLIASGLGWNMLREYALGMAVFALLAWQVFMREGESLLWLLVPLFGALFLSISSAPFLKRRDDDAVWGFSVHLYHGALFAALAGVLWGGGISISLVSIEYLFRADIPSELYGDIWSACLLVLAPLYALTYANDPEHFLQPDLDLSVYENFIVQRVLAPLVTAYLLILYAYFIKIGIEQELPRGQLSYLVSGFGCVGVLTYFLGWAQREQGGALLRFLQRIFFPALIIPVAMQALALYQRVDQYGLTEARYYVAVSVVWLGGLAVAFTVARPPVKALFLSPALLLVIAAIGPLSATSLSVNNQFNRLQTLLESNELLQSGELQAARETVPFNDRKSISSILRYLDRRNQLDRLDPWLPMRDEGKEEYTVYEIGELLGFTLISEYERHPGSNKEIMNFSSGDGYNRLMDVNGFDWATFRQTLYCYKTSCVEQKPWELTFNADIPFSATYADGTMRFNLDGYESVSLDLNTFIASQVRMRSARNNRKMVIEAQSAELKLRLVISELSVETEQESGGEPQYDLRNMTFQVLLAFTEKSAE